MSPAVLKIGNRERLPYKSVCLAQNDDHGWSPRCSRTVLRLSSSMSASTIRRTNSLNRVFASHPRIFFALAALPMRMSTSAGRS